MKFRTFKLSRLALLCLPVAFCSNLQAEETIDYADGPVTR
tara:strand:- start:176263 stop:176382 length:120 start_codon:yes stop_codon:yes gene_type:complete